MTPSNPTNSQPLIYRIADALGVFHLVAPVNHTHSQSEVDGLTAALAAKMDAMTVDNTPTENSNNLVKSGGVFDALAGKTSIREEDEDNNNLAQVAVSADGTDLYIDLAVRYNDSVRHVKVKYDNILNLARALQDPDTAPTTNSTNLVTSGGVKAALNQKVDLSDFSEKVDRLDSFITADVDDKINLPTVFNDDHYSTTYIIENYTSEDRTLDSFFNVGLDFLVCEPNKIIHPDSYVIAKVIKYNNSSFNTLFFVVVEGIYGM